MVADARTSLKIEVCAHCGSIIPPKTVFRKNSVKQRILDYIARHAGCTVSEIMDAVYADDSDGGPDSPNVIASHLSQMRPRLADCGLGIKSRTGPGATYELYQINA